MNARTVKKLLRRGSVQNYWGSRSYVTVRLPLSLANPPPPELQFEGYEDKGHGEWEKTIDGEVHGISISDWTTSGDKEPKVIDEADYPPPLFAERQDRGFWTYWIGFKYKGPEGSHDCVRTPLSEDLVGQYRARRLWLKID